MASVLDTIAKETLGKSFKTYKYGFDGISVPRFDYDDNHLEFTWKQYGETERHTKHVPLKEFADRLVTQPPLFRYFLDGLRKTYKVNDMSYNNQIDPIIAGQVGVGCCTRINGEMQPLYYKGVPMFERHLIITLPQKAKTSSWDDDEMSFEHLRKKINESAEMKRKHIEFAKIKSYSTSVQQGDKIENKGIAVIQDCMVEREKFMVAELVRKGFLLNNRYLMKDGSLEYQVHSISKQQELLRFRNNYRYVVGVSKSFNPANCIDKNGRNNSNMIAELPYLAYQE